MITMTLTAAPMSDGTSRTVVPACAHAFAVAVDGTRAPIGRTKATAPGTSAWRPPTS